MVSSSDQLCTFSALIFLYRVTEVNESTPIVLKVDGCRQDITDTKPQHILRCDYLTDVGNCSHESDAALQCGKYLEF